MRYLLALLLALVISNTNAQQVQTTGNVLANAPWLGVVTGAHPNNCCTGGSNPLYDPATGIVHYSYGQVTTGKIVAVNQALSGAGIQVNGYNYSYELRNMNGQMGGQGGTDSITAYAYLTSNTGSVLLSDVTTHNTQFDWTTFSGTKTATTPYQLSSLGNAYMLFNSRDAGFWAGYYGPQIRNVSMSLNYTVDPCVANPTYSPNCAGYNNIVTSNNLVPYPTNLYSNGQSINQTYAINQALSISGSGTMIHGFDYGYKYSLGSPYTQCTATNQDGSCSWTMTFNPQVVVSLNIKDNNNTSIYSFNHTETGTNTGIVNRDYQYRFTNSRDATTLGSFGFTATTTGAGSVWDMYSKAVYTPDPCIANPLYATTCSGYAQAYHDQQCSINTLYATTCPGYAQAYFNQQCTNNPLYNASCPGYATAYHNQQCSINPLYATDCTGYAQAYHDQQCSLNPLYATDCTGYAAAYHNQQCSLNALYASDCPGYTEAYNKKMATEKALSQSTETATAAASTTTTAPTTSTASTPGISDPVVSGAVSTPSTTSATSPTSVTSVIAPAANSTTSATSPTSAAATAASTPAAPTPAQASEKAADEKKTGSAVASVERKSGGNKQEAAKAASAAAKENMEKAAKAATMEDQAATQGLVVGLMGYVPGFSAYQNSLVPDINAAAMAKQYNKPNVDNRNAQRRLSGANEVRWQEMVDSQYKLGK